ncbi:autotransporter-associated N-terminal domain-containing protein [Fusobacterium sp. PH5-44]|uniref:autotransporter-associated N-terminal domain-containing protein n=1 Tax=unclassified Fusobacterium TaxID=2648384 RepID=UPI003D208CD8
MNNLKNQMEKSLKRFLKKKIAYTASLLIAFLITGGIGLASSAELAAQANQSQEELLANIEAQKSEILLLIEENEKAIKEAKERHHVLLRQGDYYSKPVYDSTQVFFNFAYENSGKMKNRTKKEFKETYDAMSKLVETSSIDSVVLLDEREKEEYKKGNLSNSQITDLLLNKLNGIMANQGKHTYEIDLGVEIELAHPKVPTISKDINVKVEAPNVNVPTLSFTAPISPTITAPTIIPLNIAITAPDPVAPVSVSIAQPPSPSVPEEKVISITPPTIPNDYEPLMVTEPESPIIPTAPTVTVLTPAAITFNGTGFGQDVQVRFNGSQGIAAMNWDSYSSSGITITANETTVSWIGDMSTTTGGIASNLPTSSSYGYPSFNTFISDVLDHDVMVSGTYSMATTATTKFPMFISLNPYQLGMTSADDKTFEFAGDLTLTGVSAAVATLGGGILGIEHQLLAGGGSGTTAVPNVNSGATTSILKNTGNIYLDSGYNMIGIMIDTEYFSNNQNSYFKKNPKTVNDGLIQINENARQSVAIDYGYYYIQPGAGLTGPNTEVSLGNIVIKGQESYGYRQKYYAGSYYDLTSFDGSTGVIKIEGNKNVGIFIGQGMSTGDPLSNASSLQIEVGGNQNVGFLRSDGNISYNSTAMDLDSSKIGTEFGFATGATNGALIRSDANEVKLSTNINLTIGSTGNTGLQSDKNGIVTVSTGATLKSTLPSFYGITVGDFTSSTGAIGNNNGTLDITSDDSIGMAIASGNFGTNSGTIKLTGDGGVGIYNVGTFDITGGTISATGQKSSAIFNVGTTTITGNTTITANDGATGIYSASGSTMTSSVGNNLKINVTDSTHTGVGIYATGGTTTLTGAVLTVNGGSAGAAAINAGTVINLQGGTIDFNGNGYAAYSDGNGIVDLRNNGKMILRGNSAGFKLDLGSGGTPISFDGTSQIIMMSNKAVAMTLTNINHSNNPVNLTTLLQDVKTKVGGVPVIAGTEGAVTYDSYRLAATDGGNITIDVPITKSADGTGPNGVWEESYFFYRSFLAQKSKLYVKNNLTAQIDSAIADKFFVGQVSGIEMNSSKTATGVGDSLIQASNGAIILADRTDAGAGAVGVYANFATVSLDNTVKVNVETGNNIVNDSGIGIYGVDGSKINTGADIEVSGNKGVGIIGLAYREDSSGNVVGQEFGGVTGEGITDINNAGSLSIKGNEAIGIYALNNSNDPSAPSGTPTTQMALVNNGNIEVGTNIGAKNSVGIYADGDILVNLGTSSGIILGEEGIGIYLAKGAALQSLGGTITLGKDGIGIVSDGTASISATGTLTLSGAHITGEKGKVAVAYVGQTAGVLETTAQTLNLNINVSGLDHGTALHVKDKSNLITTGAISVGTEGVGIYLDNGTVTNSGNINLGTSNKAVGMYGLKGTLENATGGVITTSDRSQYGMVGTGANTILTNAGVINLNANGSVGVLLEKGSTLTDQGTVNFNASTESFAIVSDNSIVNLIGTPPIYTMNNNNKNIYVYGSNGTTVNLAGNIQIDGVAAAGSNKSVGIYLDGTTRANTITATGSLTVKNGAIGVYSKGSNTLSNGTYNIEGDKTIGVYLENGGVLNGSIFNIDSGSATSNAIGIYGVNQQIQIGSSGIQLNLGNASNVGTGIYMANGASLKSDAIIDVYNSSTSKTNAALYYTSGTAINEADLDLKSDKIVGIYTDGGINLTNQKSIIYSGTSNLVGAYVGGGSTYNSESTGDSISAQDSAGIYVANGTGVNKGQLTSSHTQSVAMVAKGDTGATAIAENTGKIIVNNGVGILVGDTTGLTPAGGISGAKNSGIIEVNNGSTGAALSNYDNSSFDGTNGKIDITDGTGIYLLNTTSGKVTTTGILNLASSDALGVYTDGGVVDFQVKVNGASGVGVYARNTAQISNTIDASNSNGTIGLYLDSGSNGVTFNNANVISGNGNGSVGIFFNNLGTYTLQGVTTTSKGQDTIGMYINAGNNITDKTASTVDDGALGIFIDNGATYTTDGVTLNLGNNATGIFNKGTANIGTVGNVTINFAGNGAIGLYNDGGILNIGSLITLTGSGSGTFAATTNGSISNSSTLNVSDRAVGILGKYHGAGSYLLENTTTGVMNVSASGIGIAAMQDTGNPTATNVVISNQGLINVTDTDTIGIYTDVAAVSNTGTINVINNGIGMYVTGTGSISNVGNVDVTGGIGIVTDGVSISGAGSVVLNSGSSSNYSIGGYYTGISTLPTISIAQNGDYSILGVVDNSNGLTFGNISIGSSTQQNQLGYMLKNSTGTAGNITVAGNNNIGMYGENSTLTAGQLVVADSVSQTNASVGIYMETGNLATADVTAGDKSIGIYGEKSNINTGNISIGDESLGVYAKGKGVENVVSNGNMVVGNNGSIGIYSKKTNVSINATTMSVGNGTSAAVISEGDGNVTLSGNVTVADKVTSTGSLVVYKKGANGNIQTSGNWNIGKHGYGIFAIAETGGATGLVIANNANITLDESGVGIYADGTSGKVVLDNNGSITVGTTNLGPSGSHALIEEHENSVGMYITGNVSAKNSGTITSAEEHSVAVFTADNAIFENAGTINVSNGSIGIFARTGSNVINSGTINVLSGASSNGIETIGIASYFGTTITNTTTGVINAGDGIGIYVAVGGAIDNKGLITVNNGVGILGPGSVVNAGTITVTGSGSARDTMINTTIEEGAITIDDSGIKINGQYVSVGGTFIASKPIVLDGAYVDITTITGQTVPLFTSPDTSGTVHLTPNFATLGNGYAYTIENFASILTGSSSSTITIETSPMFITKVASDGSLYVAKKPYTDFTIGSQFDELTDALDNILYTDKLGTGKDSKILKNLNAYLETVYTEYGEKAYNEELSKSIAETRGDIYSTTQRRMTTVQNSFDNSFEELLSSYNTTKDSGKFSVMYKQGSFEDDTIGIDDYDYRVQGLLYMKEYEGRNFGNKWGYTLGFAVSRFDFDDAPTYGDKSKEDIYSVRAGLHNVHNFNEEDSFRLVSRIEIGYNRHEAERTLELDKVYKNDGKYNSYQVTLDNRFEKTLYRSLASKLDLYAGVNLEYGAIDEFSEKGDGLELKIKGNDYFSVQPEIGFKAETRAQLGKKVSAKLFAEGAYAYELGDNNNRTKAKVRNGSGDWYNLIRTEKEEGALKGKVGLTIEKANKFGVTFDVEAKKHDNKKDADVAYSARIKYVF